MNNLYNGLKKKIEDKTLRIAVVGLGYVGLPRAVEFVKNGYDVIGIDSDKNKVRLVNKGRLYIKDIDDSYFREITRSKKLQAASDYSVIKDVDCISICVPTPLGKTKDPDISYVLNAAENIQKHLKKGHLVILESTTYPGTTRERILPLFEKGNLRAGRDFFLAYSPERIDPGNKEFTIKNTPKILSGITKKCRFIGKYFYSHIIDEVFEVSSTEAAEMVKLLENTFRIVNIALVDEVALMCDKLNLNVWEIIDAASTKPFGYMKFYPGPGLGGHCIPVDPLYLSWKLKSLDYRARFIELAAEINSEMPRFVVNKIVSALNSARKPVNGSKILLVGVSYKKDVSDTRESPALDILTILEKDGAKVYYHDPLVAELDFNGKKYKSRSLTKRFLGQLDCAVIVTDHSQIDYSFILNEAAVIIDTRNVYKDFKSNKVVTL